MPSVMTRETDESSAPQSTEAVPLLPRAAAHCVRCGYQWFPRAKSPVRCPKCGTIRWNTPRAYKLEGKPEPTRKPKPRGIAYDSQTGAQAASIRFDKTDPERTDESPPGDANTTNDTES